MATAMNLMAFLTRHPRYMPEIKWSSNSWTHNVFRVWELLFGRREGIRIEMETAMQVHEGKQIKSFKLYTVESSLAFFEGFVRNSFALPKFKFVQVPEFAFANAGQRMNQPLIPYFNFAIALDAQSNSSSTGWTNMGTSYSMNHTISGSDTMLVSYTIPGSGGDTCTGNNYNGAAMTIGKKQARSDANLQSYLFYKIAPTTGTNSLNTTFSGAEAFGGLCGTSYTGCAQQAPEASAGNAVDSAGPGTVSITTITDNAWVVGGFYSPGTTITASAGTTFRGGWNAAFLMGDKNGPKTPAGATSLDCTYSGSGTWIVSAIALAPVAGGAAARVHNLTSMGVGA